MIHQRPSDRSGRDAGIGEAPSPADIAAADERLGRVDFTRRLDRTDRTDRRESADPRDLRDDRDTRAERTGEDAHLLVLPPAKVEAILAAENARLAAEAAERGETAGTDPEVELAEEVEQVEEAEAEGGAGGRSDGDVLPARRDLDVGRSVEDVAATIIASMKAIEETHHRHLEALEAEATRRYELLLAQAELDAELIRLHGRREAHRIIATARTRADTDPRSTSRDANRLQEIGETFTRFAESIESSVSPPDRGPGTS